MSEDAKKALSKLRASMDNYREVVDQLAAFAADVEPFLEQVVKASPYNVRQVHDCQLRAKALLARLRGGS